MRSIRPTTSSICVPIDPMTDPIAAVPASAERARTAMSGVNLDEEAARLLQYQQAYQAAAKVIATANEMFRSLLQAAG